MPSGSWSPKKSAPTSLSRGDGPSGSNMGTLNGPISNPMKTTKTAAICIKNLSELIFRVLFLENFSSKTTPKQTIKVNIDTTSIGEFSVTIFFPLCCVADYS